MLTLRVNLGVFHWERQLHRHVELLGCLATSRGTWLLKLQRPGGSVTNERMGRRVVYLFSPDIIFGFLIDAMPRISSYQGVVNLVLLCWYWFVMLKQTEFRLKMLAGLATLTRAAEMWIRLIPTEDTWNYINKLSLYTEVVKVCYLKSINSDFRVGRAPIHTDKLSH